MATQMVSASVTLTGTCGRCGSFRVGTACVSVPMGHQTIVNSSCTCDCGNAVPLSGVAQMERAAQDIEAEFEKAASPPPASPPRLPARQPNPPPALPPPPRQSAPTPPPTSPSSSGASMSGSIGDAAAGIRGACDIAGESTGLLGHAIEKLEEAKQRMMAAAEGTAQADVGEAIGLFDRAIACCQEAQGGVAAAQDSATNVAGRL
jgi:hypothetical protein